jgi:hypothetical protein
MPRYSPGRHARPSHRAPDVELTFRDDGLDPIDLEKEGDAPDVVGISVNSKTAARGYAIADVYRKRGTKVVLGGIRIRRRRAIAECRDFGLHHSWLQNLAYGPINVMMHELGEKKIAQGDRAWRKHRAQDVPFGLCARALQTARHRKIP